MTKILLTGANGLLGQKLTCLLSLDKEIQVVATSTGPARFDLPQSVKYIALDITQRGQISKVMKLVKPDIIIHTAAMTNVDYCEQHQDACWEVNVQSVVQLLQAAEEYNSFFIHLSTDFIFDGKQRQLREDATPNPINFYGHCKLQAERFVKQSKVDYAILRTALVYGLVPNMSRSNIVLWVKNSLETPQTIRVVDDQYRTPTLAEDLAMGCFLIAQQRATGVYNISGGEMLTPYQMALSIAYYFGLDEKLISRTDASGFSQLAKRPPETGLIIDKARKELGYHPCSFLDGLLLLEQQLSVSCE